MFYLSSEFHDSRVNTYVFMEGGGGGGVRNYKQAKVE